ncbi:MAG: hypothetical protein IKO78_05165 [Bacilli bacterium]|nr:hypothetical protein [Bacilli bacterium]
MFNYIKWELKDFLKKGYKLFLFVIAIFVLFLILPIDAKSSGSNPLIGLVTLLYSLIFMASLFGSYFVGTYKVNKSFNKKTFLLESMIPISAKKILLAKYLFGILINLFYLLTALLALIIFVIKGVGLENTFEGLKFLFENLDLVVFLKLAVTLFITSLTFMSSVVLFYVLIKCIFPKSNNWIVGIILTIITIYILSFYSNTFVDLREVSIYAYWAVFLGISAVCYWITSYLIENKLEIYN